MNEDYPEIDFDDIRVGDTVTRDGGGVESQITVAEIREETRTSYGSVSNDQNSRLHNVERCTWHLVHRPEPAVVLPQEPTRGVARVKNNHLNILREGLFVDDRFHWFSVSGFHHDVTPSDLESFTPTIAVPKEEWEAFVAKLATLGPTEYPETVLELAAEAVAATERLHGGAS